MADSRWIDTYEAQLDAIPGADADKPTGGMSLRVVYALLIVVVLAFTALLAWSTYNLSGAFERVIEATDSHIAQENAAHQLMDASDYLTERVQRFTVDGDTRFLEEYFTEAFVTSRREDALAKMSNDSKSEEARDQLQRAMDDSLDLMNREYYAMRLVIEAKGIKDYPAVLDEVELSAEDAALSRDDKMERATQMVVDSEYYNQKDSIREEMSDSLGALEAVTRQTEADAIEDFHQASITVHTIIVLQILVLLFVVLLTISLGINPVLSAADRIKEDKPLRDIGSKEFRFLSNAYNKMLARLNRENELLKNVSQTDTLTGIRNRMALRNDYDSYKGSEVTVMLLDLDKFKSINDFYGHEEGDRVLRETGKLLADAFGKKHCYRYGGDEFLVVDDEHSEEVFAEKVEQLVANAPIIERDGEKYIVGYSIGYVHAVLDGSRSLRDLFAESDQLMYKEKRNKLRSDVLAGSQVQETERAENETESAGYTGKEMKTMLDGMSGMYDLARVVDPIECRILEIDENGVISRKERCYGIWNAGQKCVNCTSALACQTGCHQEKKEAFDGNVYHIQSNPVKLRLPDGGSYDAVVELVSVEKGSGGYDANDRAAENENHKAARYLAQHDALTKAYNPTAFSELSREAIAHNPKLPWTMVTSNIMDFRLVNTLFGSQRGNEILVGTAAVLRQVARSCNGLCGRLGGDQFALLMPRSMFRKDMLIDAAEVLAEEFSCGQYTFCIHFGVYEMDDPTIPVSVMCDRANTALRTIHDDMMECVAFFDNAMMQKSLYEQEVISGFESALEDGQFQMYLQPFFLEDGRVLGAEALVRWCRPDGEVTMPADFIETLERSGLIHKLDMHIWECAVKQLAAWDNTSRQGLTISVNVSAKDFYFIDVYQVLTDLMNAYKVPTDKLRLEITETALLEDMEIGNEVITKLRQSGFVVEIDDFGKGHSSLSLLKDISADVLKIDMSLLCEIETKQRNRTILESIINMANSLGMKVVAEGVETEAQLNLLVAMGCRYFQGYHFSRPITLEEFEQRYESANGRE